MPVWEIAAQGCVIWRPGDAITSQVWVNIGYVNDLLPDGTKPLPNQMLTLSQPGYEEHITMHFQWK